MSSPIDPEELRRAFEFLDAIPPPPSEGPLEAHLVEGDIVELRTAAGAVKMVMALEDYEQMRKWKPDAP